MSGSVAIEVFPEKKKSNLGNIFMKRTIQFSLIGVVCLLGYLSSSIYQKVEVEQVSLPVSLKETVLVENPQRILHEEVTEIVSKVVPEVPQGPLPDSQSWNHAKDLISQKLLAFESNGVLVDERSLVIYHVGEANIKDSMEVAENNMKIFTSAITQHTSKAAYKAIYLFNVIGHNNHLAQFIPTDNENVAVLKWDSSSSDMLTHTRTVELLGAGITEQFNAIVFLNQGSRGPLNKRADGEWLRDFSRLLSVEKVGLAGASISCEVAPHVQTHTFAVKPSMIPTMSALLADAKQGNWVETVKHFEVDLSVWARSAGFEIGSNLYSRRGNQDSFSKCLTPAEGSPKTVTANPTSWCDLKASEVTFQKWGGEPLRTNGFMCEAAKDNMYNTLVELQKAEPSLTLTIPETLMGGHRFDMYQQYQQEVRVSGDVDSVTTEDKSSDKVCFLVRAYDSSEKAAQSPFIHYGLPSIISSLQKQNDPNWLAVFVNTDNRDYFSTLSATVGSYSDARLKTIDIPKEFRPAFTTADAGYTATDYALREMETWAQCKYITVTNSDNVYGSEVVQRVLSAVVHDHHDHHSKVAPDMLLAPLDSRNFAYQDLSNRGLETIFSSRCTEIMAMLDFMHLAATAQPIPKLGKVDLASMFFNRVKLVQENLNFNDVKSPICPGCQDGLFAEFLIQNRAWNYQRMPIDGLQSIVFHGPSPTLCIASGNVWFDYPLVNGVGCYNHSMVVTLYHDAEVNTAYDWGNYDRNDRMCLRLNEDAFLNVANGQPVTQDASLRKLSQLHLFESSILPTETPTETPSEVPSKTPSQAPSTAPSVTPSAAPSVTPSQAPSATPSEAPSAAPSVTPSQAPSQVPTNAPIRPSRTPSQIPSARPSRTPSVTPSVVPSQAPSEVPSAVPTDAPALYFDVTYGLAGLTSGTLDTAGQNAICATTESKMGVSAGSCTFLSQNVATTRRMLSWSKKDTFTINVVLAMKVYTAEFPNLTTKDELRDFLAAEITTAVSDGSFVAALETDYELTVESMSATVGQYVATVSPTQAPSTPVPSFAPTTQVPSEAPSAAPTMPPPVKISIPAEVTLGSPKSELDDKDQDALCTTTENIAGTPPGSAVFTSQQLVTRRKLVGMKMLETYQIKTVVTITASTESFPEMANSPNATSLFESLTATMAEAVSGGEFVAQLQEVSATLNATGTATVSELAVVATAFTVITDPPTMVPSVAPSVEPSAVPSATPSVMPSATPSVEPTASPSATPSVEPSAVPSATPSVVPSATPSVEPSATPSVVPSATPSVVPSATPSVVPSATPSVVPSATPSVEPSAEPSLTPSSSPTVRPTRSFVPTNVNSVPPVMIVVSSEFSLSGLNADTLDQPAQQAVCTSTEEILTLPTGSVSFTGQEQIPEARRLSGVKLAAFKVKAFVTIRASSDDFAETFSNPNATVLFNKVRTTLNGAVSDNSFATKLRVVSTRDGADITKDVTDVTVTTNSNYVVSDSLVGEKDGDDLTAGYFAGVVIGVIIFFMVAFAVFWYFFVHEKKQPVEEPDFTAITSIPPREREIADPDQLFLTNGAEQPIVISNGDDLITLTEIEARM